MSNWTKAYPLTKMVTDGHLPTKLSPVQYNAYRDEQTEIRNMINGRCAEHGRKPVFTNGMDDFSKYHVAVHFGEFRIIKREKPLDVVDYDLSGNKNMIQNMAKTMGERMGIDKPRGKYNDGVILADQDACSIEMGEVQGNGGGGYGAC